MTADKILSIAKSYIGVAEKPANSNNVIFNTHYYGKPVSGSYPWCCTFVWDVFRLAGASALFFNGQKTAYCPAVQTWATKEKLTVDKLKGKPGDLVLFDWNKNNAADHIGFILENKGGGTYTTIEGNTSVTSNDNGGKVMQRTRKTSEILMIIRPKYRQEVAKEMFVMKTFKNTSGKKLTVYADTKKGTRVGELYANTTCKALDQQGSMVCIRYTVNATGAYKVGWVEYVKGVQA